MRRRLTDGLQELDTVAERVVGVEAAVARELTVDLGPDIGGFEAPLEGVELVGEEGGVAASGGYDLLDTAVDLLLAAGEPDAATVVEGLWLGHFGQAEQTRVEPARNILAAGRDRELDVDDAADSHGAVSQAFTRWRKLLRMTSLASSGRSGERYSSRASM